MKASLDELKPDLGDCGSGHVQGAASAEKETLQGSQRAVGETAAPKSSGRVQKIGVAKQRPGLAVEYAAPPQQGFVKGAAVVGSKDVLGTDLSDDRVQEILFSRIIGKEVLTQFQRPAILPGDSASKSGQESNRSGAAG